MSSFSCSLFIVSPKIFIFHCFPAAISPDPSLFFRWLSSPRVLYCRPVKPNPAVNTTSSSACWIIKGSSQMGLGSARKQISDEGKRISSPPPYHSILLNIYPWYYVYRTMTILNSMRTRRIGLIKKTAVTTLMVFTAGPAMMVNSAMLSRGPIPVTWRIFTTVMKVMMTRKPFLCRKKSRAT